jgi:hypothetical protein
MRTEEDIRKEMERCEKERNEAIIGSQQHTICNVRYWALRWVLDMPGMFGDKS